MSSTETGKWKVQGYDTFEGGADAFYSLPGEFDTEQAAIARATSYLAELEQTQPSSSSGGQSEDGIQDQVYIVHPDGEKVRFPGTQGIANQDFGRRRNN